MKIFTVYLDSQTGRTQVTFEAEKATVTEKTFEFTLQGLTIGVFAREKAFGFVEERPRGEEGALEI